MNIDGNSLSGSIPTELFLLSGLTDLNFGKRNIHELFQIQMVYAGHILTICFDQVGNNFTGTLPTEIGLISNLNTLDFRE